MEKSMPTVQTQPDKERYSTAELSLFQQFNTREAYQAAFGVEPPPFDLNQRPKFWFDSSVDPGVDPEDDIPYRILRQKDGNWGIVSTVIPAWEAAKVNIPPTLESAITPEHPEYYSRIRPAREMPVRDLLPNEALSSSFGGLPVVVRLDKQRESAENSGKFLATDRELLYSVAKKLGVV